MNRPLFSRRALVAFASLVFASLVCTALVIARWYYTRVLDYRFMIWNLFLAWIPFVMAFAANRLNHARGQWGFLIAGCALTWLLFLPNAPYLLTDLVHLRYRDDALVWYDLMLLLWFAWTGFMLGFGSIYLMQQVVTDSFGPLVGWAFAIGSIGLTSFGIYLGRFLRWNSWDVLRDPIALFADIYYRFRHPIAHVRTHVFWLLLALFLLCVYVMFTTLPALRQKRQSP
jgi:uncharacterized membrane protein